MSDNNEIQTLRDKVLATLPLETHTAFLRLALDAGIHNPDDAAWGDVALAYTASLSSAAATKAAEEVRSGIEQIPGKVREGATAAGADVCHQVTTAAGKVINDAAAKAEKGILRATEAGSTSLKNAMQGLEAAAQKRQAQIVDAWSTALAKSAEKEARATLFRISSMRWIEIGSTLLLAMIVGAVLMTGALYESGKVLPLGWAINNGDHPACGYLREPEGTGVCFAVKD